MIKPIETLYKGYRFRSRLEARWAVFFDAMGLAWSYEPEGYVLEDGTLYLPDFWLPELNCFAEVKPTQFTQEQYAKCAGLDKPCLLLDLDAPQAKHGYFVTKQDESNYLRYLRGSDWCRVVLECSKSKGRLWFLLGEDVAAYSLDLEPEIAAKSVHFEYGE